MVRLMGAEAKLAAAFEAAEKYLNYDRARELTLRAVRGERKGYACRRDGDTCTVEYGATAGFFAGTAEILSHLDGEKFEAESNLFCEDLGLMADCARNGVLSLPAIERMAVNAAFLGYTYLELYVEDCMEIDGQPFFGYMRGAYTKEEMKQAVAVCARYGIELVPCVQTLAHLNQAFRWPAYEPVNDCNDILLAGEEETYRLLDGMIKTIRECFPGSRINIGMDEAHFVGLGKYLDRNGYRNRFEILEGHLKRVIEICEKYGFRPAMWSDMFFRLAFNGNYYAFGQQFPEEVRQRIPDGVDLIYWDYYNTSEAQYREMMALHRSLGKPVKYGGGLWCWNGFAPLNGYSRKSMLPALAACRSEGVSDIFFTMWGDNGSECSRFAVLPSMALFAELVRADSSGAEDRAERKSRLLTGYGMSELNRLDLPNYVGGERGERIVNPCKYLLYNDPLAGIYDAYAKPEIPGQYAEHAKTLKGLAERGGDYAYLFDTMAKLCGALELKSLLGVEIKAAYDAKDTEKLARIADTTIPELIGRLEEFYAAFLRQWNSEYKSFGFEIQDVRLGGLLRRLSHTAEIIKGYLAGKVKNIAELEQPRLRPWDQDLINLNCYAHNVSACCL